ncbi:MAG: hypothetical protein IT384_34620 [Deltaproteobacteria bacterium]|nr:hypothetical protein [Deltaproteobacteria bacterium]
MDSRAARIAVSIAGILAAWPGSARADGKRDLEDGIAFYENLDTERAIERLRAATKAADLGSADRARAFLYLGIVSYEIGRERDADAAWKDAFAIDPKIPAPPGTSPKVIQAMDKLRAAGKGGSTVTPTPPVTPGPGEPKTTPEITPEITPAPPPVGEPSPPPTASGGTSWLLWGGIGVAAVGAVVLTIVLISGSGSACAIDRGGCASVALDLPGGG